MYVVWDWIGGWAVVLEVLRLYAESTERCRREHQSRLQYLYMATKWQEIGASIARLAKVARPMRSKISGIAQLLIGWCRATLVARDYSVHTNK